MRGRPLWELLLFALVWGLLLVPLLAITRVAVDTEAGEAAVPQEDLPAWVQIRFSDPPMGFVLYSQSEVIWEETDPANEQEVPLRLVWDEQGQGDMRLMAVWDLPGRRATEVRIALPSGPERRQLLWHEDAALSEALLFP